MAKRYKGSGMSFTRFLLFSVGVFLVVFVVFFAYRFTDGFTMGFQSFYVVHDGENIFYEASMTFETNKTYSFDCKDTFKFLNSKDNQCGGYTVNVYPAESADFDFSVDGFVRSYNAIGDISAGFAIVKSETSFSIKADKTMQEVLNTLYPDKEVVLPVGESFTDDFYYVLVIGNKSGSSFVYINFKVVP